jgi:hypothetical protein
VSSSYAVATPQRDGRCYVTETFVLDDGTERQSMYLAEVKTDYDAHLALMVDAHNEQLAVQEAEPVESKAELQDQIAVIQSKIDAIDVKDVVDDGK